MWLKQKRPIFWQCFLAWVFGIWHLVHSVTGGLSMNFWTIFVGSGRDNFWPKKGVLWCFMKPNLFHEMNIKWLPSNTWRKKNRYLLQCMFRSVGHKPKAALSETAEKPSQQQHQQVNPVEPRLQLNPGRTMCEQHSIHCTLTAGPQWAPPLIPWVMVVKQHCEQQP